MTVYHLRGYKPGTPNYIQITTPAFLNIANKYVMIWIAYYIAALS